MIVLVSSFIMILNKQSKRYKFEIKSDQKLTLKYLRK